LLLKASPHVAARCLCYVCPLSVLRLCAVSRASQVCARTSLQLWRRLNISAEECGADELIVYGDSQEATADDLPACPHEPSADDLRTYPRFRFSNCGEWPRAVTCALKHMTHLVGFGLWVSPSREEAAAIAAALAAHCTRLEELELRAAGNFTGCCLLPLAIRVKGLCIALSVAGTFLLLGAMRAHGRLGQLEELSIWVDGLSEQGYAELLELLRECTALRDLNIVDMAQGWGPLLSFKLPSGVGCEIDSYMLFWDDGEAAPCVPHTI